MRLSAKVAVGTRPGVLPKLRCTVRYNGNRTMDPCPPLPPPQDPSGRAATPVLNFIHCISNCTGGGGRETDVPSPGSRARLPWARRTNARPSQSEGGAKRTPPPSPRDGSALSGESERTRAPSPPLCFLTVVWTRGEHCRACSRKFSPRPPPRFENLPLASKPSGAFFFILNPAPVPVRKRAWSSRCERLPNAPPPPFPLALLAPAIRVLLPLALPPPPEVKKNKPSTTTLLPVVPCAVPGTDVAAGSRHLLCLGAVSE